MGHALSLTGYLPEELNDLSRAKMAEWATT